MGSLERRVYAVIDISRESQEKSVCSYRYLKGSLKRRVYAVIDISRGVSRGECMQL